MSLSNRSPPDVRDCESDLTAASVSGVLRWLHIMHIELAEDYSASGTLLPLCRPARHVSSRSTLVSARPITLLTLVCPLLTFKLVKP